MRKSANMKTHKQKFKMLLRRAIKAKVEAKKAEKVLRKFLQNYF